MSLPCLKGETPVHLHTAQERGRGRTEPPSHFSLRWQIHTCTVKISEDCEYWGGDFSEVQLSAFPSVCSRARGSLGWQQDQRQPGMATGPSGRAGDQHPAAWLGKDWGPQAAGGLGGPGWPVRAVKVSWCPQGIPHKVRSKAQALEQFNGFRVLGATSKDSNAKYWAGDPVNHRAFRSAALGIRWGLWGTQSPRPGWSLRAPVHPAQGSSLFELAGQELHRRTWPPGQGLPQHTWGRQQDQPREGSQDPTASRKLTVITADPMSKFARAESRGTKQHTAQHKPNNREDSPTYSQKRTQQLPLGLNTAVAWLWSGGTRQGH